MACGAQTGGQTGGIDVPVLGAQNALLIFGVGHPTMKRLRTIPGFVRVLVGLFLMAQLAGVVSSPRANATPTADADVVQSDQDHGHHQNHEHHHGGADAAHHGGNDGHGDHGNLADTCCALHAYFAGVMPPVVAVTTVSIVGERFAARADDQSPGVSPSRLDRPPRPLR
jgi:hypothetical protein